MYIWPYYKLVFYDHHKRIAGGIPFPDMAQMFCG